MISFSYAWNELRRRIGRTLVTAIGLAAGVGLVMGIIGVSEGLSNAQTKALSPLGSVGTDIIVTRTVAPTLSTATTTTTTPSNGFGGGGSGGDECSTDPSTKFIPRVTEGDHSYLPRTKSDQPHRPLQAH